MNAEIHNLPAAPSHAYGCPDTDGLDFSPLTNRGLGVFFNMDEDDYHADRSLSNSGIKALLQSPMTYWDAFLANDEWLDGWEEEEEKDAYIKGKAIHCLLLEGEEEFKKRFTFLPEDFNGRTKDGKALKAELKKTFTGIMTHKERREFDRIRKVLSLTPTVRDAFKDGWPEVSMFWRDQRTGIPMRARIDYAKPGLLLDLKSYANIYRRPPELAMRKDLMNLDYGIQPVHYTDGFYQLREASKRGELIETDDPEKLKAFLSSPVRWYFVFIQKGRVPELIAREYARWETFEGMGAHENEYWSVNAQKRARAIQRLVHCWRAHGPDRPWIEDRGAIALKDSDFPGYAKTDMQESIDAA